MVLLGVIMIINHCVRRTAGKAGWDRKARIHIGVFIDRVPIRPPATSGMGNQTRCSQRLASTPVAQLGSEVVL